MTSSAPATVIGSGQRTSLDLATFANGVMIRFLDFNDGYTSTGESGHPSDSIAAVLTRAEAFARSGRDVIAATVLAYEVFCRICDEADLKPLGFDHVTVGGMASTAAAARLFGLPVKKIAEAFNLGIAPNLALYQTRIGHVSMWKGCAYANASRNAVFAAMLASRGMTGPAPIFEGVGGYFKAVTRAPFQLAALGGRDHPYKIMECSIKRYPLGQYSQTVVQAALELREKIRSADEIAEIRIETVSAAVRLMAGDPEKWTPATRETADHSMPYTVAVALIHGGVESQPFRRRVPARSRDTRAGATRESRRVGGSGPAYAARDALLFHAGHESGCHAYDDGRLSQGPLQEPDVGSRDRSQVPPARGARAELRRRPTACSRRCGGSRNLTDAGECVRLTVAG